MPQSLRSEDAFTLAEVLIAATLMVMLSGFVYVGLNRFTNTLNNWEEENQLENISHQINKNLRLSVQKANNVSIDHNQLEVLLEGGNIKTFYEKNRKFYKGEKSLLPSGIYCIKFKSAVIDADSLQSFQDQLSIRLTLTNRIDTIFVWQEFPMPTLKQWYNK